PKYRLFRPQRAPRRAAPREQFQLVAPRTSVRPTVRRKLVMALRARRVLSFRASSPSDPNCPICEEERRTYLFVIHGLPVARCPGCGLVSLSPMPSHAELPAFYNWLDRTDDPRLIWNDGETERDAATHYLNALAHRDARSGRLLVVAPPDHRFSLDAS